MPAVGVLDKASPLLEAALKAEHLVLSSAGPHAQEDWHEILARKAADIQRIGHTVWVLNSNSARPDDVQRFCRERDARHVLFLSRVAVAAAKGTTKNQRAQSYSVDNRSWKSLDRGLTNVTGDIKRTTTGFWLDALEEMRTLVQINVRDYRKQSDDEPLSRFWPSDPAYLVRRAGVAISSGGYKVLAVGRLAVPFAVWLRA